MFACNSVLRSQLATGSYHLEYLCCHLPTWDTCVKFQEAYTHGRHTYPHTCVDADDFDPDAGFAKREGDRWEGEDEGLDLQVQCVAL